MSSDRSTDEIEREIEEERVALSRTLTDLQRQVSPEVVINQITGVLRDSGGDLAGTALRNVRENPMAAALTGAGVAWLIFGQGNQTPARPARARITTDRPTPSFDARSYPNAPGLRDEVGSETFETRVAQATDDEYDPAIQPRSRPSARRKTTDNRDGMSLRDRLLEGTEMMTETAREKVIEAREAAIAAEQRLEAQMRSYGNKGRDAFTSQPLVGALLAFGVGAAIGAMLPRTRSEDRYLGVHGDRAMAEAERVYRMETARLRAVAEAAADEAKRVAADALRSAKEETPTGKDAVDMAEDKVREAADRVTDAAKSEAEKRKLGSSLN